MSLYFLWLYLEEFYHVVSIGIQGLTQACLLGREEACGFYWNLLDLTKKTSKPAELPYQYFHHFAAQ